MARADFREIEDLATLKKIMSAHGAIRLYVKKLAPNDNSKNQPYLGGDFEALTIIPNKGVIVNPKNKGNEDDNYKAKLDMYWVDANNRICPAPGAQLILYPKYPEIRLSGFLQGCEFGPSETMSSRAPKRRMFLGITTDGKILGHVTGPENPIYQEVESLKDMETTGVFFKIPLTKTDVDTRDKLIKALRKIHRAGWLESVKMGKNGVQPYKAANGGGYTLEAHLGISPNGRSDPDYLGWEVKQHGVVSFNKPHSGNAVTLFTPEPTAGIYKEEGIQNFMHKFGYADKRGRPDRLNFGGIYYCEKTVLLTGVTLKLTGYNNKKGKIEDPTGGITLIGRKGEIAAIWLYSDLLKHWERKHNQTAYVPSLCQKGTPPKYWYGNLIELGQGTDFLKFLKGISEGFIYYDPGIKIENVSTKPKAKLRSQFRTKPVNLARLYKKMEIVDVMSK